MRGKFILGSGMKIQILRKVTDYKSGLMVLNSKDFGLMIKLKDTVVSFWQTVMFIKAAGSETKPMVRANTFMLKVLHTKEDGTKISRKAKEKKSGQMVHFIMESISEARNMEKVFFSGPMEPNLTVIGKTTKCMELELLSGLTEEFIKESI